MSAPPSVIARLEALERRWDQEARESARQDVADWVGTVSEELGDLLTWMEDNSPNEQAITDQLAPVLDRFIQGHEDCKHEDCEHEDHVQYDAAVECLQGCIATVGAVFKAVNAVLAELPHVECKLEALEIEPT